MTCLVKGVGPCAPVGEEHAETNSFEETADNGDGDGVDWAFLGDDLCDDLDVELAACLKNLVKSVNVRLELRWP